MTVSTLEESHRGSFVSTDHGATFSGQTLCRYDQCGSTGDPAYLGDGSIIVAAGWYGMYKVTDKGAAVEKLDNVSYAKTVGYGAPKSRADRTRFISTANPRLPTRRASAARPTAARHGTASGHRSELLLPGLPE